MNRTITPSRPAGAALPSRSPQPSTAGTPRQPNVLRTSRTPMQLSLFGRPGVLR